MPAKALVTDASPRSRGPGQEGARDHRTHSEQASFFVPEMAYAETEEHLPTLVMRRGGDPEKALRFLRSLRELVDLIGSEVYSQSRALHGNGWATGIQTTG